LIVSYYAADAATFLCRVATRVDGVGGGGA